MLCNDIKKDIKTLIYEDGRTQTEIAEAVGTSKQYLTMLLSKKRIINPLFVQIIDELGYDVELVYKKKND